MSCDTFKPTVFLDRDGTLNQDIGYIKSPDEFRVFPFTGTAIQQLNKAGIRAIIATNQSGISRGYFSLVTLQAVHEKLRVELHKNGAWIDDIFYCPHHPDEQCYCRKPNPGMLEQASAKHNIDLTQSYVVGDKYIDFKLAQNVGAHSVLVKTGPFSEEALSIINENNDVLDFIGRDLSEAVDWIVGDIKLRS